MNWQDAYFATLKWLNEDDVKTSDVPSSQRISIVTGNRYCPIARFPNERFNATQAWSVRIHIIASFKENAHCYSKILVKYLNEKDAPQENFKIYDSFEIYEGPNLVGIIKLHNNKRRYDYAENKILE